MKAVSCLRDATFMGHELVHDEPSHTVTLTLTRSDSAKGSNFALFGGKKQTYLRTVIKIRSVVSYKQFLTAGPDEVYVFDRGEVERAGEELSFYFRPGDRAVMGVEQIDGSLEDVGKATAPPKSPIIENPILTQDRQEAKKKAGVAGRMVRGAPKKRS